MSKKNFDDSAIKLLELIPFDNDNDKNNDILIRKNKFKKGI